MFIARYLHELRSRPALGLIIAFILLLISFALRYYTDALRYFTDALLSYEEML